MVINEIQWNLSNPTRVRIREIYPFRKVEMYCKLTFVYRDYVESCSFRIIQIPLYIQSTPVISKSKGPVYSFDITVFSL